MRERRRLHLVTAIKAARTLQRTSAQQAFADSLAEETKYEQEKSAVEQEVRETHEHWTACVSADRLEPHLLGLIATALRTREARLEDATQHHQNAVRDNQTRRDAYAMTQAHVWQSDLVLTRLRRRVRRSAEEKRLAQVDEAFTYEATR